MATGSAEYYKLKLERMRNELLKDMGDRALRIQKDLDQVKTSARGLENKISDMDGVVWNLKRELTKVQAERDTRDTEILRLKRQNRQLKWRNFELECENETLSKSLRIYKDTTEAILACRKVQFVDKP